MHKLDYGLDHLLIDEAQDNSAEQWRIVEALTDEFFAGEGARPRGRTVFAVGDEKQSIFSFQGAAPEQFAEMRRYFERRHREAEKPFESVPLNFSFRSAPAILAAVDMVFGSRSARGAASPARASRRRPTRRSARACKASSKSGRPSRPRRRPTPTTGGCRSTSPPPTTPR